MSEIHFLTDNIFWVGFILGCIKIFGGGFTNRADALNQMMGSSKEYQEVFQRKNKHIIQLFA